MARISQVILTRQPVLYTLTIRKTINFMEEFANFADYTFDKIAQYLESLHELPSDGPIVCFHNMDLNNLDVEAGFLVAHLIDGKDDMCAVTIPAQKVVSAIDLGPYEDQDPTLTDIFTFIESKSYEAQGKIYYQYLNDTKRSENELLTKMILPIK